MRSQLQGNPTRQHPPHHTLAGRRQENGRIIISRFTFHFHVLRGNPIISLDQRTARATVAQRGTANEPLTANTPGPLPASDQRTRSRPQKFDAPSPQMLPQNLPPEYPGNDHGRPVVESQFSDTTRPPDMSESTQSPNEKSLTGDASERVPKQVRWAAWLAVFGTVVTAGVASATPIWPVAAACISVAAMTAVVCYAIVRYR